VIAMTDLRSRFQTLDRLEAPDLWAEAIERAAAGPAAVGVRPSTNLRFAFVLIVLLAMAGLAAAILGALLREPPIPSLEPPNGWVAYSRTESGMRGAPSDIYLVAPDRQPRLISQSSLAWRHSTCLVFSPDGMRLAYLESTGQAPSPRRESELVIVSVDSAGSLDGPEVRVPLAERRRTSCPVWSPDSLEVAYTDGYLWVVDANGREPRVVKTGGHQVPDSYAWSPDGSALAAAIGSTIWRVPIDGAESQPILSDQGRGVRSLRWSPDGRWIAFVTDVGTERAQQEWLRVADLAGSEELFDLAVDPIGDPAWSPESDRIAWIRGSSTDSRSGREIVISSPQGEAQRTIAGVPRDDGVGTWHPVVDAAPAWSPDGQRIVFIGSSGEYGWGDSVLVSVAAKGNPDPILLTDVWYGEYYSTVSWQTLR